MEGNERIGLEKEEPVNKFFSLSRFSIAGSSICAPYCVTKGK